MNIKGFEKWCDDKNKNKDEDNQIYFDYREWEHKIDYLDKFVKVLWDYWTGDCFVDEWIGLINNIETVYINEEFLDYCIENKIYNEQAYDLYQDNLDANMDKKEWEYIGYEETLKNKTK